MAMAVATLKQAQRAAKALESPAVCVPIVPGDVLGILAHGKYAKSSILEAAIASYRTLIWVSAHAKIDKDLYVHIYKMIRASKVAEVMEELKKLMESKAVINLSEYKWEIPNTSGLSPEGSQEKLEQLGSFFYRNAWDVGSKGPEWVGQKSLPDPVATRISSGLAAPDVLEKLNYLDKEEIPYVLANMLTNMASFESSMGSDNKEGMGRFVLYEASRYLSFLNKLAPQGIWERAKLLRVAMLTAATRQASSTISKNRESQYDLLLPDMPRADEGFSYWLELGKLVKSEMDLSSSSSPSGLAIAWFSNALFVAEIGEDLLGISLNGRDVPYLLEKMQDRMGTTGVLRAYKYYQYLREPPHLLLPLVHPLEKMSKTKFIRSILRDATGAQAINARYHLTSLEDPYLFALLRRMPDLYSHLPEERAKPLVQRYYKHFDEIGTCAIKAMDRDTYKKYWDLDGKATKPKELAKLVTSLEYPDGYTISRKVRVKATLPFGGSKGGAGAQISLWMDKGAPGLPEHVSIERDVLKKGEVVIAVEGSDWKRLHGTITTIISWLVSAGVATSMSAKYTFSMFAYNLEESQRELAVQFLSEHSATLAKYLHVPQKALQYPVRDIGKLKLLPDKDLMGLASGMLFDLCGGVIWGRIHVGREYHWSSLENLLVAVKFLEKVLDYKGPLANDYVLPSTFLYRAGLHGDLFQELRDGFAAPTNT